MQDQHDAIDFTDNAILTLGNLPLLKRLHTLLLANNRIQNISPSIHLSVPNLQTLVLTNNLVTELGDLEPLKELRHLKYISLMGNPVTEKKWYREWLAFKIPSLRVIDFQRIRDKVRSSASYHSRRTLIIWAPAASFSPGARTREDIICDSRRTAHRPRHNYIYDCIYTHHKNSSDNGRAQGRTEHPQSRPSHVQRRPGQGKGCHRQGHVNRGGEEIGKESTGGLCARDRVSRSIISWTVSVCFRVVNCCNSCNVYSYDTKNMSVYKKFPEYFSKKCNMEFRGNA